MWVIVNQSFVCLSVTMTCVDIAIMGQSAQGCHKWILRHQTRKIHLYLVWDMRIAM
jgi:hypothetical protein